MKKGIFKKVFVMTLTEVLLSVLLFIVLIFSFSYVTTNLYAFTDLGILTYGSGAEVLWMALYLGTNSLFTLVIILVLLEIALFTLRMMAKVALNTISKVTGKENLKIDTFFKNLSIIALIKKIKIDNRKRAIIAYLVLMVLIFGVKLVTKSILSTTESNLYRVYENISLYHDTYTESLTDELDEGSGYTLIVNTSVGNIHLYTMSETTDMEVIYYYDTLLQKCTLDYQIDKDTNTIQINFNQAITTYEKYVDDLLPQIELYLPETLPINNVEVHVENYGTVAMEYFSATELNLFVNHANVNIDLPNNTIDSYYIEAQNSTIRINTNDTLYFDLIANHSTANITLGDVKQTANFHLENESSFYLYQAIGYNLNFVSNNSILDIREVYATNLTIDTQNDDFTYLNGSPSNQPDSISVIIDGSKMNVKGLTYDSEGENQ
ncbi:MAG: hypothetical protein AB7U79_03365 [Candidatus Izemoplasmatales bacterium]